MALRIEKNEYIEITGIDRYREIKTKTTSGDAMRISVGIQSVAANIINFPIGDNYELLR